MSILAALGAEPMTALWLVWLGVAGLVALFTGLLRPRPRFADGIDHTPRRLESVPLLAVAGLVSFCAYVTTQLVYFNVRHPTETTPAGAAAFSAVDLTRLALLSALVGWAVGFAILVYGGGLWVVGFGLRRLLPGLSRGVLGVFIALPVVICVLQATLWTWQRFSDTPPPKHELLQAIEDPTNGWLRLAAVAAAVIAAPLFEELLFRGCVQGGLRRATRSPWVAIGITSLLFASIHPRWTMPAIFTLSVMLGLVYERTRNLWAVTVMHALFNAFSIVTSSPN